MSLFLDFGFAWIATFCMVVLLFKYFSRKLSQNISKYKKLNKILKKTHIPLGVLLIVVGLIHGMNSSVRVFSFNVGTILWIFTILLGINFVLRSKINKFKSWIIVHRWLSVATVGLLIWHIISVGGIKVFSILFPPKEVNNSQEEDFYNVNNNNSISTPSQTYFNNNVILNDGTYKGSAYGYRGTITVSVSVENGKVANIEVISIQDDRNFYSMAERSVIPNIITKQSLKVDTVSGATYSSKGIINAVNNALSEAVISGELPSSM